MGVWKTYLPLLCFIFCPFLSDMTSFLTQFRLTTPSASGENWGQLILQPNHGAFVRHLFELLWRREGTFDLAKRLESTKSLCSTRPPTDWPNLNTCATLQLLLVLERTPKYRTSNTSNIKTSNFEHIEHDTQILRPNIEQARPNIEL